ncbi:amino acid transporter AVT1E [Selaginella moellendorffii]|nr:amino acid transporter AVT1E [Selaginella moellendorffii]|eukprot:XP_024524175.1 amino acid transporter AVT1E [Selaginella moellendorffii]
MGSLPPLEQEKQAGLKSLEFLSSNDKQSAYSAAELEAGHCAEGGCPCDTKAAAHSAGQSSFFQAVVNSFVLLIGLGTLSSAYAIEKAGFFGLLVLCITAAFYWIGSKLIVICMEADKSLMNYQDVGNKAFPRWGRLLITTCFYIDILGCLVGYLVSMGDTMMHIFPHPQLDILGFKGKTLFTLLAFLVILPSVWFRKLSTISYLSFWCGMSIITTIICLLVAGVKDHIGFSQDVAIFRPANVPIATGVYTFTFGATAVFPSVYKSMKNPSRFTEVMTLSFSMAALLNVIVGIIGSVMFGAMTKAQVHLNMPPALIASKVAIWATLLTPVTQFALFLSPISCELEQVMIKYLPWKAESRMTSGACIMLRTTLLIAIAMGALLFPYFANIIELIGSSVSVTLCVIFPGVFYLKLFSHKIPKSRFAGICVVIGVSALAGVAGTIVSIQDLIHK